MFDISIGVEQLQVAHAWSQALVPVGDASPSVANQVGETGVDTIFNIIELGTRIALGLLTAGAVLYFIYGCWLLMRAAGNPQMLERARMQMILALAGAALGAAAFLSVGTAIDFLAGASGNTIVDVGDVSKVNTVGREFPPGSFLGIYGGEAILCPTEAPSWTNAEGSVGASWTHTPATTGSPPEPAFCTSQ